jgi:LacI family transcriptional regulator
MNLAFFYSESAARLEPRRLAAVAVLVSDIANPFFAKIIPAIEERLSAAGFVTLVGNTSEDRAKEERILKTLREFPPRGILMCPSLRPEGVASTPLGLAGRLPAVAFARPVTGLDYAGVNYALGAELAVDHLYQIGHRKIAFVGGNPNAATGQERLGGYRQALARWGLPVDPRWVVACAPNRAGGQRSLEPLLQLEDPPTAAVCFNDLVALGVMATLERSGKKPGAQFGVIGFNDVPAAAASLPRLTTVDTSPRQVGEAAAELLLRRITNRNLLLQTVVLQPRLIVRESCGMVI